MHVLLVAIQVIDTAIDEVNRGTATGGSTSSAANDDKSAAIEIPETQLEALKVKYAST